MKFKECRKITYPVDERIVGRIERRHLISVCLGLNNSHIRSFHEVQIILIVKSVDATLDGFFRNHRLSKSISMYR